MTPEHDPVAPWVARDVAAQGEEAEAPCWERDLLPAVFDTAGALVLALEREGRKVSLNRACDRATGYLSEARGRAHWDLYLVPEEVPLVRAVFEPLRTGQSPNPHKSHTLTKDGARRPMAWADTALAGAGGTVEYAIGTGVDAAERRHAETQTQPGGPSHA